MGKDKKKYHNHNNGNADLIGKELEAKDKEHKREDTRKLNRLWLWLGVLILIAILLWFIFFLGWSGEANLDNNG